ncbi:MAG: peptidase T [Candidatus Marinimicrobia bacterium]|nr:peptidase T [Candidatus Neomarinimicrobiota bacterium]
MKDLLTRFLDYTKIGTRSNENSETCPSTEEQWQLANYLKKECEDIGLTDVKLDKNAYLTATLASNIEKTVPTIGFLAHMDTAQDASGDNVKAQIIENYDGKAIKLKGKENLFLDPKNFPELLRYKGQKLITTDGTTLLGADDKAGIAAIVAAMEYLIKNPQIKHGKIRIGFTPDEEIGRGADLFDVKNFGADFAYTVDGGEIGEFETENFNAARADIDIEGINVHPGTAKNQMRNALNIAMELHQMLPVSERPEYTENHEGFYHLISMSGAVDKAELHYIIRDHDRAKFENKKDTLQKAVAFINDKYQKEYVTLTIKDQYYNMKEIIDTVPHIIDLAVNAIKACDITPLRVPVRGGTDGSRLSYMGLPCPNIFTGGHNYHGIYEYLPYESLEKSRDVVLKIIELAV